MVEDNANGRVFISYSRADLDRAEEVRAILLERGFDAFLDQHDIAPGEPWRERLGALITSAEKVVFLISPASVKSEICDWEVNHAERLGKAVLPVVTRDTSLTDIPERLKRLNFVFMRDERERDARLPDLIEALEIDLGWEREKTRLGELTLRWDSTGRPNHLLLRDDEAIRIAETWRDSQPAAAPPPTDLHLLFIATSRQRYVQRQRTWTVIGLAAAAIGLGLAAFAWLQRDEAIAQRNEALSNQSRFLTEQAEQRMDAGDYATAMLLALAGLPDQMSPDEVQRKRPTVAQTRRVLRSALQGNREMMVMKARTDLEKYEVADIAFSPVPPPRVATASTDHFVRIWDLNTGEVKSRDGHEKPVNSVDFSPDGALIVTADDQGKLLLWDAATGTKLLNLVSERIPERDRTDFFSARFSPVGRYIVSLSANADHKIQIWDVASGERKAAIDVGDAEVDSAEFDAQGTSVLIAWEHGVLLIIDALEGGETRQVLDETPAKYATFSPAGERILIIPRDGQPDNLFVRVMEVGSGTEIELKGHTKRVKRAAFSRDGKHIVTASADGTALIWNASDEGPLATLAGHEQELDVNAAEFSPDGERVVTGSADRTARIWDARIDRGDWTPLENLKGQSATIAFRENGDWLIAAAAGNDVGIWTAKLGAMPRRIPSSGIIDVAVSSNGARVAAVFADGTARVWNASDGRPLTMPLPLSSQPYQVALSPDGQRVAVAREGHVQVWTIASQMKPKEFSTDREEEAIDLAFGPKGDMLAAAFQRGRPRLWDLGDSTERLQCEIDDRIALSPDGHRIACIAGPYVFIGDADIKNKSSSLRRFRKLDTINKSSLLRSPLGHVVNNQRSWLRKRCDASAEDPKSLPLCLRHEKFVENVAFSADGRRIVTVSRDPEGALRVWDVDGGEELARFADPFPANTRDGPIVATFAPDGDEVLTVSFDGVLGRWRLYSTTQALVHEAKRVVPRCLTAEQLDEFGLREESQRWCEDRTAVVNE